MKKPLVLVRQDLNMPKGKVCAQVSHALMVMVLNLFHLNADGQRVVDAKKLLNLTEWINKGMLFDVQYALDIESIKTVLSDLSSDRFFNIMDQGRTVFNGQTTWTVSMIAPVELSADPSVIKHIDYSGPLKAKQSILVTTRPRRNVLIMAEDVARASVSVLLNKIIEKEDGTAILGIAPGEPMDLWLNGSFGKIVLGTKTSEKLQQTMLMAIDMGIEHHMQLINGNAMVLAIGPDIPEKMSMLTSEFRPL